MQSSIYSFAAWSIYSSSPPFNHLFALAEAPTSHRNFLQWHSNGLPIQMALNMPNMAPRNEEWSSIKSFFCLGNILHIDESDRWTALLPHFTAFWGCSAPDLVSTWLSQVAKEIKEVMMCSSASNHFNHKDWPKNAQLTLKVGLNMTYLLLKIRCG